MNYDVFERLTLVRELDAARANLCTARRIIDEQARQMQALVDELADKQDQLERLGLIRAQAEALVKSLDHWSIELPPRARNDLLQLREGLGVKDGHS